MPRSSPPAWPQHDALCGLRKRSDGRFLPSGMPKSIQSDTHPSWSNVRSGHGLASAPEGREPRQRQGPGRMAKHPFPARTLCTTCAGPCTFQTEVSSLPWMADPGQHVRRLSAAGQCGTQNEFERIPHPWQERDHPAVRVPVRVIPLHWSRITGLLAGARHQTSVPDLNRSIPIAARAVDESSKRSPEPNASRTETGASSNACGAETASRHSDAPGNGATLHKADPAHPERSIRTW